MRPSGPTLTFLREATRGAHAELDHLSPLGGEPPTRAGYALHLRALADLVSFAEAHVYATPEWRRAVPDHARRAKADLLAQDLRDLGVRYEALAGAPLPVQVGSFGYGMGVSYVLEGSTLGGAFLAKRLRASLGDAAPLRYVTAYGGDVTAMWSAFCASLEACPSETRGDMGSGARDAFAAVKRRLVELGAVAAA